MNIKVSIIMPSLNVADYIEECMESVINQTLRDIEIICVDAGSTDGTREILENYARKDARIRVIDSSVRSYGHQVNMGLEYAGGEYVAVLETDDWIDKDMYRCMYGHAVADGLDYVAADFDTFYELQNGYRHCCRTNIFAADKKDWYGKILDSDQIATLRASDYVLWRGIYRRKFVLDNNIRLHESPRAAFQDMGFLQQTKTFARRAKYIDESFYRYRKGRPMSSSVSSEGLRYYEGEFRWLGDNKVFCDNLAGLHKKYYYFTMSISLITKYEQILECLDGDWQDLRLAEPYEWFWEQIMPAVNSGLLEEGLYGKERWDRLMLLLTSREEHAVLIAHEKDKQERPARQLCQLIGERPVVIFGCGRRGERLMFFCDSHHVVIDSFGDNNASLYAEKKFGFRVISPEALSDEICVKNGVVLLSMKEGREGVREQLVNLGIEAERIISEIPEGIL